MKSIYARGLIGGLYMLEIRHLKCEGKGKNLLVKTVYPSLSWTYNSDVKMPVVTGYMEVKNSEDNLIWRSEPNDSSYQIRYGGEPLKAFSRYWWRAAAYDEQGTLVKSDWSFFDTTAWGSVNRKASWISLDNRYIENTAVTS